MTPSIGNVMATPQGRSIYYKRQQNQAVSAAEILPVVQAALSSRSNVASSHFNAIAEQTAVLINSNTTHMPASSFINFLVEQVTQAAAQYTQSTPTPMEITPMPSLTVQQPATASSTPTMPSQTSQRGHKRRAPETTTTPESEGAIPQQARLLSASTVRQANTQQATAPTVPTIPTPPPIPSPPANAISSVADSEREFPVYLQYTAEQGFPVDIQALVEDYANAPHVHNVEQITQEISTRDKDLAIETLYRTLRDPENNSRLVYDLLRKAHFNLTELMNLPIVNELFPDDDAKAQFRTLFLSAVHTVSIPNPVTHDEVRQLFSNFSPHIKVLKMVNPGNPVFSGLLDLYKELHNMYPELLCMTVNNQDRNSPHYGYTENGRPFNPFSWVMIHPHVGLDWSHPIRLREVRFDIDNGYGVYTRVTYPLSDEDRTLTVDDIDTALEAFKSNMEGLDLRNEAGADITDDELMTLCRALPNLRELFLPAHATNETMRRLREAAPNLRYLDIRACNNVTSVGAAHFTSSETTIVGNPSQQVSQQQVSQQQASSQQLAPMGWASYLASIPSSIGNLLGSMMP